MALGSKGNFGKVGGVYAMKIWHVPLFLLRMAPFSLRLQLGIFLSFNQIIQYVTIIIIISYLLILIFIRPYKNSILSNFSVILNELTVLYSFTLPFIFKLVVISYDMEVLLLFGLEDLLVLCIVFTILRVMRYYYSLLKMPCKESELH